MTPDFLQQIPALKEQAALLHQAEYFSLAQSVIDKTYLASAEHMPVATLDDFHFDRARRRIVCICWNSLGLFMINGKTHLASSVYSALGQNYGFGLLIRSERKRLDFFW